MVADQSYQRAKQFNQHWMPIYGLCDPCNIHYDFIIKIESLAEESKSLLSELGIEGEIPHMRSTHNKTESQRNGEKLKFYSDILEDVKADTLRNVLAIFKFDFTFFDYDITPFHDILLLKEKI